MDVDLFLGIRAAEIGKSQLRRPEAVHGGGGGEELNRTQIFFISNNIADGSKYETFCNGNS